MAERNRAAVRIDLGPVDAEVADEFLDNHGESFVDFPDVDIVLGQARLGEHLAGSRSGGIKHQRRAIADLGHGDDPGTRLQSVLFSIFLRGQKHPGRAVDHARRNADMVDRLDLDVRVNLVDQLAIGFLTLGRRHVEEHLEGRLELGEAFRCGIRARIFLMVEDDVAVIVFHHDGRSGEAAFRHRDRGAALAFDAHRFQFLTGDAFHRGDGISADALVRLRTPCLKARVVGAQAAAAEPGLVHLHAVVADVGHHFHAARDSEIVHPGHNHASREIGRGDAGAAEAVKRDAAGPDVIAGIERGIAADVTRLQPYRPGHTPDDVVDVGGVEIVAIAQGGQHCCRKMLGMHGGQRALAHFANAARRTDGVNDIGFGHEGSPLG